MKLTYINYKYVKEENDLRHLLGSSGGWGGVCVWVGTSTTLLPVAPVVPIEGLVEDPDGAAENIEVLHKITKITYIMGDHKIIKESVIRNILQWKGINWHYFALFDNTLPFL